MIMLDLLNAELNPPVAVPALKTMVHCFLQVGYT
jgi:hypothetical protein